MWRRSFLFCFGEWRRKNMLSYFHKKVYSRTIFLMSKFFVIWDLQLLPGPFNSLFWYEICSKSQKLSLSFFLTTFDSTCFCSLTWLSINALLWLILYFIFYIVVRQGNYFLLPSTQRKWPHFSNKEKRIKMKIYCSNEEHCFHIHRLFFFFISDIYFIASNTKSSPFL